MFWLSRVSEHSHYLTGIGLPLIVFAAAAGLIFVPLTMTLVAGIADEHSGVASSMFNAGQQIGGAVGLAVIGSVAWTVVNRHVRDSLSDVAAGRNLAEPTAARPGSPIYDHALSSGVTTALTMGAGATVLALIITVIAIRVRREDLPDSPLVMSAEHGQAAMPRPPLTAPPAQDGHRADPAPHQRGQPRQPGPGCSRTGRGRGPNLNSEGNLT